MSYQKRSQSGSYNQSTQGSQGSMIRGTTDSRDTYRGSFRQSVESGRDTCTEFGAQVVKDKIYLKVNELDKKSAMIKQQLMSLAKISKDIKLDNEKYMENIKQKKGLSSKQKQQKQVKAEKREERHKHMRQGINDMMHEQMKLIDQIQVSIKNVADNEQIGFENILNKKIQSVEQLGKILIQQEKEFIVILKQQSKIHKKMGISSQSGATKDKSKKENKYELENLLNESSSDDDKDSEEGDGDDSWEKTSGDANDDDIKIDFGDDEEMGNSQNLLQMEEQKHDPNIEQFQERMNMRTQQIGNVTSSIGRIQDMFQSLNEIVSQQGQTLDRLEDNMVDAKDNTKETVSELKGALEQEPPSLSERITTPIGSDLSTTCVIVWFFFALLMFLIDFHGTSNGNIEDQIAMGGRK